MNTAPSAWVVQVLLATSPVVHIADSQIIVVGMEMRVLYQQKIAERRQT